MAFTRRLLLSSCVVMVLAGCAMPLSPTSLRKAASPQTLVLAQDVFYTHQTDWPVDKRYYAGLLAGTFVAELEDDRGTYFRGTGSCVVWADDPTRGKQHLAQGGIWIGKGNTTPKYLLYRYLGSESTRPRSGVPGVQGSPEAAATAPSATAQDAEVPVSSMFPKGASPMQAGVGAGIAAGIVALTEGMDDGKIALQRPDTPPGVFDGRFTPK